MSSLIVVFPKLEDAKKIRDVCVRCGFEVDAVCTTAASALAEMNIYDNGIVISGYKLPDMFFGELKDCMPAGFEMLLICSRRALGNVEGADVMSLAMPLSVRELADTLGMMQQKAIRRRKKARSMPRTRSQEEQTLVNHAKALLMERNHMTESEAHRYLQKHSMDNGTGLVETAQMILTLLSYE